MRLRLKFVWWLDVWGSSYGSRSKLVPIIMANPAAKPGAEGKTATDESSRIRITQAKRGEGLPENRCDSLRFGADYFDEVFGCFAAAVFELVAATEAAGDDHGVIVLLADGGEEALFSDLHR